MEEFKRYTMKDLRKAFEEAGYPVADRWIRRQIEKGNLVLPRSTTHFASVHLKSGYRKQGAVYQLSMEQIQDVVKAFLPGGTGYYNYQESND
jgi:hypothetical protein